jgi:hypothetical protein
MPGRLPLRNTVEYVGHGRFVERAPEPPRRPVSSSSLQEIADRLARIALSICLHDSDPDIDEAAIHDRLILTGRFMAELRGKVNA